MARTSEDPSAVRVAPVRLSRIFPAPRELVFKAWSSTEHVKRWFCPEGFTVPEARVEMRVGGPFEVLMRAPDGVEHWARGTFAEVAPVDRLVLDLYVSDGAGRRLFRAVTEASFADDKGGTCLEVVQTYTVLDPAAAWMAEGAPKGWHQTLDKLEREILLMQAGRAGRRVVHATFHLERTYDAPVGRVFAALSEEAAKSRWFGDADGQWQLIERHMDFRVGGRERLKGRWQSGMVSTFDAVYHDIVPLSRIVYTYEMHLDERKISVSLATLELEAAGPRRTVLKVTEQGAFLDSYDDGGSRERGTAQLLERLGASLGGR